MRPSFSFQSSYPGVRAVRTALAAGAVAGLVVIAACTDSASKAVTAPPAIRAATIGSGGFGTAKILRLCVSAGAPAGTYTFKNDELNRSFGQDSWSNALAGNGFWDGAFWSDPGDGGDGATTANALEDVNYTVSPGGCVDVLTRTVGDAVFMAALPNTDPSALGQCDPADPSTFPPGATGCGGENDSFAAANILFISASNGYLYDHTDCEVDEGALMPQHITNAVGNPSPWPGAGFNSLNPAFATYGCGSSNNPTRGFANFEHGETLTFFFHAPPTGHDCTFTQGYYKNHEAYTAGVLSNNLSTTYIDASGHLLIGAYALTAAQIDAILGTPVGKGYNAGGVVFTKDQLAMIHQLIAAELNIAGGADPTSIVATITAANANYTTASKSQLSTWTNLLDNFNKGVSGPGHCSS